VNSTKYKKPQEGLDPPTCRLLASLIPCLFGYLLICLPVYLLTCLFAYLLIWLSAYLITCLFFSISFHLFYCLVFLITCLFFRFLLLFFVFYCFFFFFIETLLLKLLFSKEFSKKTLLQRYKATALPLSY